VEQLVRPDIRDTDSVQEPPRDSLVCCISRELNMNSHGCCTSDIIRAVVVTFAASRRHINNRTIIVGVVVAAAAVRSLLLYHALCMPSHFAMVPAQM